MRHYYTWNVFTNERFSGNSLAIVTDCDGLNALQMQLIARELGQSATAFVWPSDNYALESRTFTKTHELGLSTHSFLGIAADYANKKGFQVGQTISFRLKGSLCIVEAYVTACENGGMQVRIVAPLKPVQHLNLPPMGMILTSLSLSIEDIRQDHHHPRRYNVATSYLYVPLKNPSILTRIAVDSAFMCRMFAIHRGEQAAIYAYALGGPEGVDISCRMFAPNLGIPEDPATGSAAVGLAHVLQDAEPIENGTRTVSILQGEALGRIGRLTMIYHVEHGDVCKIELIGDCVFVGHGTFKSPQT